MTRTTRLPRPLSALRRLRGAAAALALALGPLAPAPAPAQEEALEVVRAALAHLRPTLPPGPAALDPEPFCAPRLIGWNCPGSFRGDVAALGYRLSGRAFTLVCLSGPESCRLAGAGSLVSLDRPALEGGRATVDAEVWRRVGERPLPVRQTRVRLALVRGPAGWRVEGEEPRPPDQGAGGASP